MFSWNSSSNLRIFKACFFFIILNGVIAKAPESASTPDFFQDRYVQVL